MKKLLALSIALLSLNLYGAELNFSKHGLEGWGKKEGVRVVVEDYSKRDKTFDAKAIKNQVELKLRLAGIKVNEKPPPFQDVNDNLFIIILPIEVGNRIAGYHINVRPIRAMTFKYNEKEYISHLSNAEDYGGISSNNYRPELDKYLDQLLLNYLKANPKK